MFVSHSISDFFSVSPHVFVLSLLSLSLHLSTFIFSTFPTSSDHATFCASTALSLPLRPLLAGVQGVKVEEEIDSKKYSHVMWRGTKEDPGGLGRLSATRFILRPPTLPTLATGKQYLDALHPHLKTYMLLIMLFCTFSASLPKRLPP